MNIFNEKNKKLLFRLEGTGLHIAMGDGKVQGMSRTDIFRKLFRNDRRAMPAAGTADADVQIGFAFPHVARHQKVDQGNRRAKYSTVSGWPSTYSMSVLWAPSGGAVPEQNRGSAKT